MTGLESGLENGLVRSRMKVSVGKERIRDLRALRDALSSSPSQSQPQPQSPQPQSRSQPQMNSPPEMSSSSMGSDGWFSPQSETSLRSPARSPARSPTSASTSSSPSAEVGLFVTVPVYQGALQERSVCARAGSRSPPRRKLVDGTRVPLSDGGKSRVDPMFPRVLKRPPLIAPPSSSRRVEVRGTRLHVVALAPSPPTQSPETPKRVRFVVT